jgi:hypothetical protein
MTSARLSVLHIPITLIVASSPLTNAATPVNAAHSKQLPVRVWRDGVLSPSPLIDLRERVNGRAERGLVTIAAHPRFESNGDLYLLYTSDAPGLDATRVGERTFK